LAKGTHYATLFSSYAIVKVVGGGSLFAFVWYPPKGIIIYFKMRLVFLYTLLGLPADAHYPVSINHSIDEKNELIL